MLYWATPRNLHNIKELYVSSLPRVAIVGRPNVGKSTFFNRITGARQAIVDPVAGSTRDRHLATTIWNDKEFEIVDTGGLFERPETTLDQQVASQVQVAMDEADLVCWIVDGTSGLVPEDQALGQRLRSISDRVLLVVNKIDHPNRFADAMEFHQLGFPQLFEISAEHGVGIGDLLDEIVERLPVAHAHERVEETRIAIVGRPNVGKSSLLNKLVGEERVVVTDKAGTTRDAIDTLLEVEGRSYRVVDTAGIRRKSKTENRADQIGVLYAERAMERAHLCILVLDAVSGLTTEDASIAGKIVDAGRGAVLAFNKWDLVTEREERAKILREDALERFPHLDFCPMVFVSALSGRGMANVLPLVDRVRESQLKKIPTPELNNFLEKAAARYPAKAKDGKEVRLLYMTQNGVTPPRFVVFASHTKGLDRTYTRYLSRRLREAFGFEGTPIRVTIRKRNSGKGRNHA
jgi:GTP-binding protein